MSGFLNILSNLAFTHHRGATMGPEPLIPDVLGPVNSVQTPL